jgi:hypothetical protein
VGKQPKGNGINRLVCKSLRVYAVVFWLLYGVMDLCGTSYFEPAREKKQPE